MGKLNFRGYLISRFYPTHQIRENLTHAKNMCFTVNVSSVDEMSGLTRAASSMSLVNCSTRGSSQKVGWWMRAEEEGSLPIPSHGVQGCQPQKIFENVGTDLCNSVHFW